MGWELGWWFWTIFQPKLGLLGLQCHFHGASNLTKTGLPSRPVPLHRRAVGSSLPAAAGLRSAGCWGWATVNDWDLCCISWSLPNLVISYKFGNLKMIIEIVTFPIKHDDFPLFCYVNVYQRVMLLYGKNTRVMFLLQIGDSSVLGKRWHLQLYVDKYPAYPIYNELLFCGSQPGLCNNLERHFVVF